MYGNLFVSRFLTVLILQKNEIAQITLKPSYAFGKDGNVDKGVKPNETVVYEIKLISFEKAKESWQLDADAKLEQVDFSEVQNNF